MIQKTPAAHAGVFRTLQRQIMMEDTIAAISTPFGEGGIGIIRISGEDALLVLEKIFRRHGGRRGMEDRKMTYGHIVDPADGKVVDEVLCVYMKGPKTYTTEDVVEINCHGGIVPLRRTLELVLRSGARSAERGEFTQRAFLGGRLDLTQAEAVMDLIEAKADRTFDVAMGQLEGKLSEKIRDIRKDLMDILVNLTVNIDYPDEDIEIVTYEKLNAALESAAQKVRTLLDSARTGRIISEGLKVAIIGKPNVGKSSLMNNLLRESRAIVTDIPGTTRDTIQEKLSVKGIPVLLTDTAGIRETEDRIENIGIQRSKASFNEADLVIFMLDSTRPLSGEDEEIIPHVDPSRAVAVLNKVDKGQVITSDQIRERLPGVELIEASMTEETGLEAIEDAIVRRVYQGEVSMSSDSMVTNARQSDFLSKTEKHLRDALRLTDLGEPLEIIELDVQEAYENLGSIIGESVSDDILNEVFSRFCLGK